MQENKPLLPLLLRVQGKKENNAVQNGTVSGFFFGGQENFFFIWRIIQKQVMTMCILSHVCGTAAIASTNPRILVSQKNQEKQGDEEFLSFIRGKQKWESSPSILVTRNPNWSHKSGTGIGCVKKRYQHLKYAYLR